MFKILTGFFFGRCSLLTVDRLTDDATDIAFAPYSARWKYQKKVAGKALRYIDAKLHVVLCQIIKA